MEQEDLDHLFGQGNVLWTYRKEWDAYPQAGPMAPEDFAPIKLADGLYYANAFEPLISTMVSLSKLGMVKLIVRQETETISAWNIASLIMLDHFGIRVGKSWVKWDE